MPESGLPTKRLVFNYSSKPLTENQLKLLEKGATFGIVSQKLNNYRIQTEMELLFEKNSILYKWIS